MTINTDIETVIDPVAGDVIDVATAELRDLARFIESVRFIEGHLRDEKRAVTLEILRRLDSGVCWTVEAEEYKITAPAPTGVTYSAAKLWEQLHELVEQGTIPESAAEAACERTYTYSAKPAGINKLKKLGGHALDVVLACAIPVDPDTRRVSISRRGMVQ